MTVGLLITLALSVSNPEHTCKHPRLEIWFTDSELQYTIQCPGGPTRFETPAHATRPRPGTLPVALPTESRVSGPKPRTPIQ